MLCSYLGIPMAPEKTVGPSTTTAFAGIELDSILMEARLPQEKIDDHQELLSIFLQHQKVTLKEIQSLTGLLNFACAVVVPGRAFLHHLFDLTLDIRSPHFLIHLSQAVKENLWVCFAAIFGWVQWAHYFSFRGLA